MTTMQEALADRFLAAAEVPDFLAETADLMNRSFANPKYDSMGGLALTNGESANTSDSPVYRGGIPTRAQNKIRSGRAGRKAARSRQALQAVGGLSYKGPWDAIKASDKPADYAMCRLESEVKARPAGTANERAVRTYNTTGLTPEKQPANGKYRSSLLANAIAQHKANQTNKAGA